MAQQCIYSINFNTHENPELYEAWFEEKSQLQVREYEGLFGFDCSDGKYSKTDVDFNKYLVGRFEEEVASGWSLKSDAYQQIQSLLIKEAPTWFTCVIDDTIDRDQYSFATEKEAIECCKIQDNCVIEQEQLLPKGIYFIGDPSYVLKEEYWHYMTIEMERGVFQDPNGITYALFRTLMGDGVFADDEGGEYVVDSGCIAVLPACVCNEEDMESAYGEVFEMTAPFTAEWEPQDGEEGDICVNNIFIHTNPLRGSNNQGDIAANDEILVLADQRFDDDQFEEAINLYTQAIELFPSNEDLFVNRGLAKEMLGDDEGAINDYQNAIKINPVNSNALFLLGSRKAQTNDLEEAIVILSKSIEIDPTSDNSSAYRYRGIARNDIGNYAEALSDFFKLIEFDSCDGESYLLIGYNYIKLENYQDSLYYLNKAIDVFEVNTGDEYDVSECHLYLGNANSKLGDLEGACRNWKIATDLDNDDARVIYETNCLRQ